MKMCDFGISGYLVDSVAKTMDAGCKPYMAVTYRSVQVGCELRCGHQGAAKALTSARGVDAANRVENRLAC